MRFLAKLGLVGLFALGGCGNGSTEEESRSDYKDYNAMAPNYALTKQAHPRFSSDQRKKLDEAEIHIETARRYPPRFGYQEIIHLHKNNIGPEKAREYDSRFSGWNIVELDKGGADHRKSEEYNHVFFNTGNDVSLLILSEIPGEEAENFARLNRKYGVKISAEDMVRFKEENISYEQVEKEAKRQFLEGVVRD